MLYNATDYSCEKQGGVKARDLQAGCCYMHTSGDVLLYIGRGMSDGKQVLVFYKVCSVLLHTENGVNYKLLHGDAAYQGMMNEIQAVMQQPCVPAGLVTRGLSSKLSLLRQVYNVQYNVKKWYTMSNYIGALPQVDFK